MCSSSYRLVHLTFCQIWFFICSFFEGAIMISFYLLSIFLSSYLVFLQCFCSIYVSFQYIDMLVFWLFCLCLPKLLLLCFFCLSVLPFFSSICLCNYLFSLLLIYWYIYVSSHLPIIPIYMSMCLSSPPSSNLSSIILSTCRCVSCWCSFYRSIYLWFSFCVLSFHDSCLSNIDCFWWQTCCYISWNESAMNLFSLSKMSFHDMCVYVGLACLVFIHMWLLNVVITIESWLLFKEKTYMYTFKIISIFHLTKFLKISKFDLSLKAIFEGSLEAKLPTIWTVEKQRWEESEEKRSEERRCRCAKR